MESKFNFTLKDLIYIVTIVLSVAGTYFTLKNDVNNLKVEVAEIKSELKTHNLSVLEYKINHVSDQLDKILEALK